MTGSERVLRERVRAMMLAHWRPEGHTVPNAEVYPWQWLWDSCFHALIWAELGRPERAVTELRSCLAEQDERRHSRLENAVARLLHGQY